ncbi:MAG TPA: hypothetical protein VL461_12255 [Dictyobacter sp.]|nr:hypothetical protein [Dictyobacter sp.]
MHKRKPDALNLACVYVRATLIKIISYYRFIAKGKQTLIAKSGRTQLLSIYDSYATGYGP